MLNYSLEEKISKIYSSKTKKYFEEVSSSYFNQNNRAAIVSLYSVLISDLLDKLTSLKEIYEDETATDILENIKEKQQDNPKSPDWENYLIEEVNKRTKLIDDTDYSNINALKKLRNLCAHPVIDKNDRLHTPNTDYVLGHIKNILDGVLVKPPILSKDILNTMLEDLSKNKSIFLKKETLRNYLNAKFFNNLTPEIEVDIFRNLWKLVFYIENPDCEDNRKINCKILNVLYEKNFEKCNARIDEEIKFFSKISNSQKILTLLIFFIATKETIYHKLSSDAQILIKDHCAKNINAKTMAWFLSENYVAHLNSLKKWVESKFRGMGKWQNDASEKVYNKLLKIGFSKSLYPETIDFIIWRYTKALNYSDADKVYEEILKPFLHKFKEEDFIKLCKGANKNQQVYGRKRAKGNHKELKEYITKNINKDFKFEDYDKVFE